MKTKKLLSLLVLPFVATLIGCESKTPSETIPSEVVSVRQVNEVPTEDGYFEYVAPDGTEYMGEFVNGLYNGLGKILYPDGCSYEGEFEDGVRSGTGTLYWNTGCIYIGEMKNDEMHGRGYMKWPMGDYYYGKFTHGQVEGFGTKYFLRDATGDTIESSYDIYVGNFVNGFMDGYGSMAYYFGGLYVGNWVAGVRKGYGKYYWEENDDPQQVWSWYEGEFDDWINGEGTLHFKDGSILRGTFDTTGGKSLPTSAD